MPSVAGVAPASDSRRDLATRIRLQTAFRILVGLALLVATIAVHWRAGPALLHYDFRGIYAVIAFVFATSFPVLFLLSRIPTSQGLARLSLAHFLADTASNTALVYLTGGTDSPIVFLYALTIINASAVLFRRGAVLTAAASAIAYGLLVDLSYYGIVRPFAPDVLGGYDVGSKEALYRVGVTMLGFFFTGLLASYFADQLRQTGQELEEKRVDLRELQVLTRNIVENLGSGLLTVDREGRITSFNQSAQEITGLMLVDVLGSPLAQLFPSVGERIRSGAVIESRRYEEAWVRRDGGTVSLGFSYSPLRNDAGEEIGTIVIFQDLTELREMESRLKREERLAAVGRLAAGIAHEIRNPLASISGSIEMLRSGLAVESEDRRLMDIILRETDRLDGLITEFLNYVKPVKHRMDRVDLENIVREIAESLRASDAGRNVTLVLPPDGSLEPVRGDRDHLKQVAWNLLLNAVQATRGKGRVEIRGNRSRLGRSGEVVILEVTDDGVGIAPDDLPRIFEPFFTTKERGTGLGLAMVHKVIEGHGGHIEVESEPGHGATFRVVLARWLTTDAEDPVTGSREIGTSLQPPLDLTPPTPHTAKR